MAKVLVSFASGLLFALGLAMSGMTMPEKVRGFLDLTGDWDPSLAFVMLGAIPIVAVTYRWIARRGAPLLGGTLGAPAKTRVDAPLVIGSALFGAGWGLVGYCPAPAMASISTGAPVAAVFAVTMLVSMAGYHLAVRAWRERSEREPIGVLSRVARQ